MKSEYCLVVDVWEGQLEIDEAALKAGGVVGMAIRLNDMNGGHHMDENFINQWNQAAGFIRFPYFVYNPWVNGAANFAFLKMHLPAGVKTVALDIEVIYAGISAAAYAKEVNAFLALADAAGIKTIIYTAQWFLPYLSPWAVNRPYWWAQYPDRATYFSNVTTWEGLKVALEKLDKPFNAGAIPGALKMWQFSGDYLRLPGTTRPIDVNVFYGSPAEMAQFFGVAAPEPEPKPEPVVKILSVKQDNTPVSGLLSISYSVDGGAVKSQVIDQRAPEPPKRVYFRVIDDIELQRDPIRNGDPATRRIWGGKGSVPLSPGWMAFAYEINKPKTGYQFIDKNTLKPFVGWRNRGDINVVEQVAFAGNIVEADIDANGQYEFTHTKYGACVYIKSLSNEAVAPAGVIMPPGPTNLPLIHNFSIQWRDRLDLSTDGRWCRILIMRNPGERLFMEKRFLSKM